jgi:hypothetical protein
MTILNARTLRRRIGVRLQDNLTAYVSRTTRFVLPALVLIAMTICAWPGSQAFAADDLEVNQSVLGPLVPGTELVLDSIVSPQARTSVAPSSSDATSLSRLEQAAEQCAVLRKKYAQSEACFAHYRMQNRGLRAGAFQRCKQLKDPSVECGSAAVP